MSELIVAKHPTYAAELTKVAELQLALSGTLDVCQRARRSVVLYRLRLLSPNYALRQLHSHQHNTSSCGVRILGAERKLYRLRSVHQALMTLKTLHDIDFNLHELIEVILYCARYAFISLHTFYRTAPIAKRWRWAWSTWRRHAPIRTSTAWGSYRKD